ncbi:MAG: efflux RND transporter permease subunit [Nitrospirae bacterium]|nr:efflux RND transporter permease subunit [Nitrospirota bacterium]
MKLIDRSIKYPVTVTVGVLLVILFGIVGLLQIPIQLTPTVDRPKITVDTRWFGASPKEVEREIVEEQEEQLKSVEGLKKLTSESLEGQGRVILEFPVGTDIDAALLKVSNKLEQVREYPRDVEKPVISNVDPRQGAIGWFILKPLKGNEIDPTTLYDFADDYIKPRLERVPGVASSNIFGGRKRQMEVIVDPHKLAQRGITMQQMLFALDRENKNVSGGDFDEGKRRLLVRTLGEYRTTQDVENVIITSRNGVPVYVRDVAAVRMGYRDAENVVRQQGEPAIAINAQRATGANVLKTMTGLKGAVAELNEGLLRERRFQLYQVYDETEYITSAISLVKNNLWVGGLLVIAILLLFLRSISSTFVIAASIPICAIGTFLIMFLLGRTLNVISLAGMSFAVGMVVDNCIVALENIYRHQEKGKPRMQAAADGVLEVWGAMLGGTLTTLAVFIPIFFIKEEAGQLFRDIAVAISSGVGLSLLVALTVIPSLAARILAMNRSVQSGNPSDSFFWKLREGVVDFVYWISGSLIRRAAIVVLLTGLSIFGSWILLPKAEYLPEGNRNLILGIILPPPGYNLEELTAMGMQVEEKLRPYWEAKSGSPETPRPGGPLIKNFFYVARGRQVFMGAISADPERARDLIPVMRTAMADLPGVIGIVTQTSLFQRDIGEGRSIDIEIHGPELERLVALGGQIFGQIRQLFPTSQARPIPGLDLGNPEVQIIPKRDLAADLNLTSTELGLTVDALVDGVKASEVQFEGRKIDLILRGEDQYAGRTQDLAEIPIQTPAGRITTLGSVADIRIATGPEQINHSERQRSIAIQVIPPSDIPLEEAISSIKEKILAPISKSGQLGDLYRITLSGTADDLSRTFDALKWNLLLTLLITYLLMASLYESFLYPLVIMFSVPPAAVGGFLGLFLVNRFLSFQPLNVLTMLGFVILIGIVVNNGIYIVDQSLNHIRNEQMPPREAIRESVRNRIRPIFMTVGTTVFGMLPLVLFPGAGSELYRGLGSVIVGGLSLSTLFTILVIPSLLSLVIDAREYISQNMTRTREIVSYLPNKLNGLVGKINKPK